MVGSDIATDAREVENNGQTNRNSDLGAVLLFWEDTLRAHAPDG